MRRKNCDEENDEPSSYVQDHLVAGEKAAARMTGSSKSEQARKCLHLSRTTHICDTLFNASPGLAKSKGREARPM